MAAGLTAMALGAAPAWGHEVPSLDAGQHNAATVSQAGHTLSASTGKGVDGAGGQGGAAQLGNRNTAVVSDGDAQANGGDTSAESGNARSGDGGNATAKGGNAGVRNSVQQDQSNSAGFKVPPG